MAIEHYPLNIQVLRDVAEALRIDRPIQSLSIDLDCKSAPTVTITFPLKLDEGRLVVKALEKYRLVRIEANDKPGQ